MVGVPKSKRCTFCKARKTKCDERWPTCGTCARAGKVCSGARNEFKFVINGSHNETPSRAARGSTGEYRRAVESMDAGSPGRARPDSGVSMVDISQVSVGGCGFKRMRLCPIYMPLERALPWNSTDQTIARFVLCLEAAPGTGNDLRILGAFLPLIPQHLGSGNTALYHAVELLLSAWTNSRRGLSPSMWLDLRMYNRALRSLTDALNDANPELLTNTLAAQCVLQKTEVLYDFGRGSNQENHAAGLIAVIREGGPTQPITEVTLHVMFESLYHMLQEDIRQGRESDFHTTEWMTALKQAINVSDIKPDLKHLYLLWLEVTAWPGLARLVRVLHQDPLDTMTATELHLRATSLAKYLQHQDETILSSLIKSGAITEVKNSRCPDLFPTCYEFADYQTAKLFSFHAMFSITAYRALQEANRVLAHNDLDVERQARKFSKRVWMAHPWLKNQTPLAVDFTAVLAFSYESGNEEERNYCIASLEEMESFRQPPPIGRWVEQTIMANAKAYTGRLPFIKTQDAKIEFDGIGCRN
ncbi:hypothetical protein F5Y19DRAFT_221210 [Xylariaceae sp. FL1651]|nr:hypothetical protein F5Y19DRAFT_221210 [Xylariaceae sp. FL1651]